MARTLYDKLTPTNAVLGVMGAAHVNGVYNKVQEYEEQRVKKQARRGGKR